MTKEVAHFAKEGDKVSWYPGHMARGIDVIKKHINLIDYFVIVIDARIPQTSYDFSIEKVISSSKTILLLNKIDLANSFITKKWINYFKKNNKAVFGVSGNNSKSFDPIMNFLKDAQVIKFNKEKEHGFVKRPLRVLIAGIPNVGKSTIINSLSGYKKSKTGKIAGVTKSKQWVSISNFIDIMDTPGILYPKIKDGDTFWKLAVIRSLPDSAYKITEVVQELLAYLHSKDLLPGYDGEDTIGYLQKRYNLKLDDCNNYENLYIKFLNEYSVGKIGRISLEEP